MDFENFLLNDDIVDHSSASSINTNRFANCTRARTMQILQISERSKKEMHNTMKNIYGNDFRLSDISKYGNRMSSFDKQHNMAQDNLVVKEMIDYSSENDTPKTINEITRQFAISRLASYGFHTSHCIEALTHTDGDVGKALEVLFYKYYGVENIIKNKNIHILETELLKKRCNERDTLKSIYSNIFIEKIKNQVWTMELQLHYLINNKKTIQEIEELKARKQENKICQPFILKTCKFEDKCRFLHQLPQKVLNAPVNAEDSSFILEIRFFKGCKYPYEPPYLYLYKKNGLFPQIKCLRIVRRLYTEAVLLSLKGIPSIFSMVSLLENEHEIKTYLEEYTEQFLHQSVPLYSAKQKMRDVSTANSYKSIKQEKKDENTANCYKPIMSIVNDAAWDEITKEDALIKNICIDKQKSATYKWMQEKRQELPAWSYMNNIVETVRKNQVVIISGETGCGKSTQVPQFILDDWIINRSQSPDKSHINIICTQPRRISAVGVAKRVAAERDEQIGDIIGYQIRFDNRVSNKTRLTFCTTGILLQRLVTNPVLSDITHVIVDEVHERSADSDFLLMLLKELLLRRPCLKIVLMSATLKADIFSSYFGKAPILNIPGYTFSVEQIFLEDALERTGYDLKNDSKFARIKSNWQQLQNDLETACIQTDDELCANNPNEFIQDEELTLQQLVSRYRGYSKQTYKNLYVMNYKKINFELIKKVVEWIILEKHDYPKTGSILIFLPGMEEIITLMHQLYSCTFKKQIFIVPLHSSLSDKEQNLVFKKTKEGVYKIVISTNLAETSITIDDCVFVIDAGQMKEIRFNSTRNMESLETCLVSQANAIQRKGRAGRVMPGVCIHLYTSYRFKYCLAEYQTPEILRIPLERLLLRIQLMHEGRKVDLHNIMGKMLEPPTADDITNAIMRLQDVGAFNSENVLTPLGHHLAKLPVNVRIGKLILFGAIFCCLDSALTIAACLSYKSPFVVPFGTKKRVDPKQLFFKANSDHLTVLNAYKKWLALYSSDNYEGNRFADETCLSVRTLLTYADLKYQFLQHLVSIGFVSIHLPPRQPNTDNILLITGCKLNINSENHELLQGLLCAALYPNIVKITKLKKKLNFQTWDDEFVNIHPSSVNFQVRDFASAYLVFQEKIKIKQVYIMDVSMIPTLSLILFSGYELNIELHDGIFMISLNDGWTRFPLESEKVGLFLQGMRIELEKLLELKMQDPKLDLLKHEQCRQILRTIVNIVTNG